MPFLIIGLILGGAIGAPVGIMAFFKLIAEADKQGAKRATWENERRQGKL